MTDDFARYQSTLWAMSKKILARGSAIEIGSEEHLRFITLCLCGEAGEAANKVKKGWRGSVAEDALDNEALALEFIDCINYAFLGLACLNVADPMGLANKKLDQVRAKHKLEDGPS